MNQAGENQNQPGTNVRPGDQPEHAQVNQVADNQNQQDTNVRPGDYVKVQFETKRSKKIFVGLVLQKEQDEYEVKFLRSCNTQKRSFTFREPEDISWIEPGQILSKLAMPTMGNRDTYVFGNDVNNAI